jgi:hypothetical protein
MSVTLPFLPARRVRGGAPAFLQHLGPGKVYMSSSGDPCYADQGRSVD